MAEARVRTERKVGPTPVCDCIARASKALEPLNTTLVTSVFGGLPALVTEKIDRKTRKGPVRVVPEFCPFCGKKYEERRMR